MKGQKAFAAAQVILLSLSMLTSLRVPPEQLGWASWLDPGFAGGQSAGALHVVEEPQSEEEA